MVNLSWIEELKQIESAFIWEGHDVVRRLTPTEQESAETLVRDATHGVFAYRKSAYGNVGGIVQRKLLSWNELYTVLVQLPFHKCETILLPWNDSLLKGLCVEERIDKYRSLGYVPVSPHVRKNDKYVAVSLYLSSHFESYDEDGYGGGDIDNYVIGVIDDKGRWAYPLIDCLDNELISLREMDPKYFIPEIERIPIKL